MRILEIMNYLSRGKLDKIFLVLVMLCFSCCRSESKNVSVESQNKSASCSQINVVLENDSSITYTENLVFWSAFKQSLVAEDMDKLVGLFNFPLKGDCLWRLFYPSGNYAMDDDFNQENFINSWKNLFSPSIIKLISVSDISKLLSDVEYERKIHDEGYIYSINSHLSGEDEDIAVIEIIKDDQGEFSAFAIMLLAKKIDGVMKVYSIICAG